MGVGGGGGGGGGEKKKKKLCKQALRNAQILVRPRILNKHILHVCTLNHIHQPDNCTRQIVWCRSTLKVPSPM